MRPAFRIEADGKDITAEIKARFVSLSINDNAGFQNDRVTLELDDREPYIELPEHGMTFRVWLGYEKDTEAEAGYQLMGDMGTYVVDEVQIERSPARLLKVIARANDTGGTLKSVKTRSWENTTFKEMIDIIAAEHGLASNVHPDFATIPIAHEEQSAQSDQGFLTHLAQRSNAVFKVVDESLYFGPRAAVDAASGGKVTVVELAESELDTWTAMTQGRSQHKAVAVRTYDQDAATERTVEVQTTDTPVNNSVSYVEEIAPTEAEAFASAGAQAGQLEREKETFAFSCVGIPTIRAEVQVKITGLRPGVRDQWLITTVTHTIDRTGYRLSGNCEIPKS